MKHVQVNGSSLCCADSTAYITSLGGPKEAQICHCRYHTATDAEAGALALRNLLDPELFEVVVADGPCATPNEMCSRISQAGTH